MTLSEKEKIAFLINFFWGEGTASPHTVNDQAAKIAYKALSEAQSCSAAMDFVPRPAGSKPGIVYIITQLATLADRLSSKEKSIYYVCKIKVKSNFKTEITMALRGL